MHKNLKRPNTKIKKLHFDDVQGDFLRPPRGTTPASVKLKNSNIDMKIALNACVMDDIKNFILRHHTVSVPKRLVPNTHIYIERGKIKHAKCMNICTVSLMKTLAKDGEPTKIGALKLMLAGQVLLIRTRTVLHGRNDFECQMFTVRQKPCSFVI